MRIPKLKSLQGKKASLGYVLIAGLVITTIVTFCYLAFSPMIDSLYTKFDGSFAQPEVQSTFQKVKIFWNAWPLVIIFGVIVWIFVEAMKKEPDTGFM